MRLSQQSLTPASVHSQFRTLLLQHLPLKDYKGSVTAGQLADLLITMAVTARTLFATVRARFPFSHETARKAVHACLPALDKLTTACADLLHAIAGFSRHDRQRSWLLAIDAPSTVPARPRTSAAARRSRAPSTSTSPPRPASSTNADATPPG